MSSINGKVIWITGASSGIGEALTYVLAERQTRLILSARRANELERIRSNCPKGTQETIRILPVDLGEPSVLHLVAEAAIQLFGHIDILINNAGVSQRSLGIETSLEVDRRLMEVNYFGTIGLTKHLLPHFLERRQGHIVAVSSIVGKFGTPYRTGYAASKHALHGFFDSLRAELWRTNVRITMICPGFINTPISVVALMGDGKPYNKRDKANAGGKSPVWCARKIIHAIERNKNEVNIGGTEVWGVRIKRYFPRLFARIIRKVNVH